MNRLIIIGNGFDLAHGMKTSYKDFIQWYILENLKLCSKKGHEYEDEIMIVKRVNDNYKTKLTQQNLSKLYNWKTKNVLYEPIKKITWEFEITPKTNFIDALNNTIEINNWVDIEKEYYKALKITDNKSYFVRDDLNNLNATFQFLKEKLIEYLKTVQIPATNPIYDKLFRSPFLASKKLLKENSKLTILNSNPSHTLFLDFNYTPTIKKYLLTYPWGALASHIQIHGDLENVKNPVIFGYGDEMDEEFKTIELKDNRDYLKFFKSFGYAYTSNYRRLTAFLETSEFEVFVLGHSCGLSDRVMLNAIFEHKFCKDIQLFYYQRKDGTNDYIDLYQNVARNFDLLKRNDMRNRVISLEDSEPLPQIN